VYKKKITQQTCKIEVEETTLTQVKSFKYLGTILTADGKSNTEVKGRVAQAKAAFNKIKKILCKGRYHWRSENKYYRHISNLFFYIVVKPRPSIDRWRNILRVRRCGS
jgi:hypothetical protein